MHTFSTRFYPLVLPPAVGATTLIPKEPKCYTAEDVDDLDNRFDGDGCSFSNFGAGARLLEFASGPDSARRPTTWQTFTALLLLLGALYIQRALLREQNLERRR